MKTPLNDHQPTHDWIEQALRAHLAGRAKPVPRASPEFRARCRAAAHGALDVLKMRQQRSQLAASPGPLMDHFQALARLAGVQLDAVFRVLEIKDRHKDLRGLVSLAQHLGLAFNEVVLRVRCSFAQLAGFTVPDTSTSGHLSRARQSGPSGRVPVARGVDQTLLGCEKTYTPARRAQLRTALNTIAEIYGSSTT